MININELKEKQSEPWKILMESFLKLRLIIKTNTPHKDKIMAHELSARSPRQVDKKKTADVEYRNASNLWIESTLEEIKGRRAYDKKDPRNMVRFLSLR
jgi:hypothetical protein